ncbi:MAG TPA: sigma factor [Mycobacteriales bacterium]
MDSSEEFVRYVAARSTALPRAAHLMCGNWHRAEDIVRTSLVKLCVAWPGARRMAAVDAYARQIMVRTFLDDRRRFWHREVPTEAIPDRANASSGDSEERIVVLRALAEMLPRQRAVLVLRHLEDLGQRVGRRVIIDVAS